MSISQSKVKQLLESLIFEEQSPEVWVQDVWEFSPLHGDTAAKLKDVFYALIEQCSPEQLQKLLESFQQQDE